nr:leucine-rich repeat protein [Thiocapsa sp.]
MIPVSLDGKKVTEIYQDVFANKGLTSVVFENDSQIVHIHARAFQNNQLTEVILPSNLQRIDQRSFMGLDHPFAHSGHRMRRQAILA